MIEKIPTTRPLHYLIILFRRFDEKTVARGREFLEFLELAPTSKNAKMVYNSIICAALLLFLFFTAPYCIALGCSALYYTVLYSVAFCLH